MFFFKFMYRWLILRNLQEPFIWTVVSCAISSTNEQTKEDWNSWDDHCEETYGPPWQFWRSNEIRLATSGVVWVWEMPLSISKSLRWCNLPFNSCGHNRTGTYATQGDAKGTFQVCSGGKRGWRWRWDYCLSNIFSLLMSFIIIKDKR